MSRDPTRTTGLSLRFEAAIRGRFQALAAGVSSLVGEDDAFGLAPASGSVTTNAAAGVWRFHSNPDKVTAFDGWLGDFAKKNALEDVSGEPWVAPYVRSAYSKGLGSAYTDAASRKVKALPEFFHGSKSEFLRSSLANAKTRASVRLLATRTFEDLKGVTATAATRMNKILASGLLHGDNPKKIAQAMSSQIDGLSKSRARLIARTECVHAHGEGALDAFESLGIEEIGVNVEWSDAGDDRECESCLDLHGLVLTIDQARGLLPRHPNCRCAWTASETSAKKNNLRRQIKATTASLESETGTKTGGRSRWAGKLLARNLTAKLGRQKRGKK